jgi:hypothetical protein
VAEAPVIALLLARAGAKVSYVTPTGHASEWSHYTGEQERTQQRLLELGVRIQVSTAVEGFDGSAVTLGCVYSGRKWQQSGSGAHCPRGFRGTPGGARIG